MLSPALIVSFQTWCNAESLRLLHAPSWEEELWSAHSLLGGCLSRTRSRRLGLTLRYSKAATCRCLVRILVAEKAKGGAGDSAVESVGWLVPWSVPALGWEIPPSVRRDLMFSSSRAGGRKTPTNVPFSICSSGIRLSLTPKPSCPFANSVN